MYNRLFTKILDSSIWLEPDSTRIVWLTLVASMDEDGFCPFACAANVANRARVPLDKAEEALKTLEAPDPNSGDPDHEGRRIERVPGGWMVLNGPKYRAMATRDSIRESNRRRVQAHRDRKRGCNAPVTACNRVSRKQSKAKQSKAEQEAKSTSAPVGARPTLEQVGAYCHERGNSVNPRKWFDHYSANGWKVGRVPMKDWKAAVRTWERNGAAYGEQSQQRAWASSADRRQHEIAETNRRVLERIANDSLGIGDAEEAEILRGREADGGATVDGDTEEVLTRSGG